MAKANLAQLLADGFVFLILRPHFQPFSQKRNAALRFDNFAAQFVIATIHGRNTVCLQKIDQRNIFFESLDSDILGSWNGILPRLEKKIHDTFLALGLGRLLLALVIQPGNAGFDFFQ